MSYGNWPEIKINGFPLDTSSEGGVEQVVVDDDLDLPTTFALTLRSVGQDMPPYRIGDKLEVAAPGGIISTPLVVGEITTITGDYDAGGQRLHIRGYDVSHRLQRGRQTRTFMNVTDSDICRRVARDAGIDLGTIDESGTAHDHVSQANQSDWDFLKSRARAIGFVLNVAEGKLNFQKPTDSAKAPDEGDLMSTVQYKLVFGQDLLEYRPRLSSAEQVSQIEVRGWDRMNKRELVGQAQPGTTAAKLSDSSPGGFAQTFGSPTFVQADHPGATSDEVDAGATALAEHIGSSFAEAEGVSRGNGDLRAGTAVSISGVADAFCGRFVLTHTRHVFDGHYRTDFEINGRQRRSLLGLVSAAVPSAAATSGSSRPNRIYGVAIGVVTDNNDPEQQGRVKLKLPWLAANYESFWAPVVQAGAGPSSGSVYIPEVGDEVLLAFESGDIRFPYVFGGLYNGQDKPKLGNGLFDNGKVTRRGFVSRLGHQLIFFDSDSKSGVAIHSSDGQLRISLNETTGEVKVYSNSNVSIEAGSNLDIKAGANLSLKAGGTLKLKGDGTVDIDGGTITLN